VTAVQLLAKQVEKIWGRRDLPEMFGGSYGGAEPLGEVWYEHPNGRDCELLVKYLFTSAKLSIQVHPNEEEARRAGHTRGKDEAWIVLQAEPGAVIGIGLRERVGSEALTRAALDGSIEDLVDWRPAAAGDIYYSPAGTIHALGPGLALIEIQQNSDVTYRLYDYGRPRELHLKEGVAVSNPEAYVSPVQAYLRADGREILAEGQAFVLERWHGAVAATLLPDPQRPLWLVPVSGTGRIGGAPLEPGSVWLVGSAEPVTLDEGSELLIAYSGAAVREALLG
jgi:mannose-6-phosphate isomerase